MANDRYTEDEYDDTYKEVHGEEPARDQYVDEDDTGFFPYGTGWGALPGGWGWGFWPGGETAEDDEYGAYDTNEYDEYGEAEDAEEEDGTWLDEGLIGTLLVVGVILFLFPEPATSAIGIALIGMGVVAWIADWAMS